MRKPEDAGSIEDPQVLLETMRTRHAQTLKDWGLVQKAKRQVVERAAHREVEDILLEGLPLILGSTNSDGSCLFIGFQLQTEVGDIRTKMILIGSKVDQSGRYLPCPGSYFDDTDCEVARLLFNEVVQFQQDILPGYDPQFGIVR